MDNDYCKMFNILEEYLKKKLSNVDYYRDLKYLLKRLVEGNNIYFLIYERPAPKDMYASRVLQELKGHLEEWISEIPEFEFATIESLFAQTWKKYVVDKSKGKGRAKIKGDIAEDLCDRYPILDEYRIKYPFSDYDSFDACGILTGYFEYAFDDDGLEKIHGIIEKTHISLVGYYWCDVAKLESVLNIFDGAANIFSFKKLSFCDEKKLHENIRMASSNYDAIYTRLPRKVIEPFMWKYGIDIDDASKCMIMFVLRKSSFSFKEIEKFKECIQWTEEVNGS